MKKVFIFCVIVTTTLLVSQSVLAQNPVNLGFRAGVNFGNATFDPDLPAGYTKSMRTGFAFGGYGEIGVADNFFLAAELQYLQSGVVLKVGDEEGTMKLDYFSIPLSAKYKFALENSTVMPFIFGGPNLGFNLSAKASNGEEVDIKDNIESITFGFHFGAGAEFEVSPGTNLFFDASYSLGLSDIAKEPEGYDTDEKMKLNDIGIKVGVSFNIN